MKGILNLLAAWVGNGIALWLAGHYIPGINVSTDIKEIAIAAGILALINLFIKPLLKLVLSPIILITLGLAVIAINAFTIYVMIQLVPQIVSIPALASGAGLLTLLYVTILVSVINIITRKII